ncbi:MAG TPA: type II secretion system protein GspM [bacterium]|nr:type II secretion system protein GspM [bacterium]
MKLTARDRKVLIIGSLVISVFVLIRFAIVPLYRYSRKTSDEIESVRFQYEKSAQLISQRAALDYELNELKKIGANFEALLIHARNPNVAGAKLQQTLDGFLQQSKLETRSKKIMKAEERAGFISVPVELSAAGSLSQLRDFLTKVMNDKMLLQVTKLTLRPENQRDPKKIFIDIEVVGYVLNELP